LRGTFAQSESIEPEAFAVSEAVESAARDPHLPASRGLCGRGECGGRGLRRGRRGPPGVPAEEAEGAQLVKDLRDHVTKEIGAIAKPRQIMVVPELPKTRSGKIMHRLPRDIAENRQSGDVTTLADSTVMDLISEKLPSAASEE
jgi:acyl-CoA synthetase (AMP-forming)/AMP-acid ligase II